MSIHAIYRTCIWLPILIPATLLLAARLFGWRLASAPLPVEMLAYSLVMGGLPYAGLAAWATHWIRGRSEADIRRLMFRAPLLMTAVFMPLPLVIGVASGQLEPLLGVAVLGTVLIILFGYGYVGLTIVLRAALGPRG